MSRVGQALLSNFTEVGYDAWRAEVDKGLRGASFEKRLVTRTLEGIDVKPLYGLCDFELASDPAGFPGAPPYRRGALPVGRHGELWDLRPRYDHPDPEQLRAELVADLERGARSVWLDFDRSVRSGQASLEPPRAASERGAACLTAAQLGELLSSVPLERVTVSLDAGSNALAVAACFVQAARTRNVAPSSLRAWLNADPLGALARDGALPFSLETAREQLCALAGWAAAKAPSVRSVTVSVVPHHDAGAHCVQELAYALATAVTYLRWLTDAGLSVAQACSQLAFSFAIGSDFFMEIAKLRAFRQCFARVVEACGGDADAQRATVHATSSTRTKTARDPWVNLLRETTEAFAASAGGADAITTSGFDRLLGTSDAFGRRLAANTQVILDQEAHVARVADPAGGSFYVEALTDALARAAWEGLQALEAAGGMEHALLGGMVAAEVAETARARAAASATRKQAITGVSEFALVEEPVLARGEPDWLAVSARRRSALEHASRDESVAKGVAEARTRGPDAWVEAAVEAAGRGATLGQLSCSLASAGEPARAPALLRMRPSAAFERLRDAADARTRAAGKRPAVFLCNLGPIPEHKARAQFASGFFAAGGFAVSDNDGFVDLEAAVAAFSASRADFAILCGSDEAYPRLAAALAPKLREAGARSVLLAGRPGDHEPTYRAAGISRFLYVGCDVVETLQGLLAELGVPA